MLAFSCRVDEISERHVVDDIQGLNYLINNLLMSILLAKRIQSVTSSGERSNHRTGSGDISILRLIREHHLSEEDALFLVVEFVLRGLIYSLLYKHYFEGDFFFGVGSETHRAYLDSMMEELLSSGKFFFFFFWLGQWLKFWFAIFFLKKKKIFLEVHDVIAIERWRTMVVEATFGLNEGIESHFNVELTTSITLLENTLKVAFPNSKTFEVGYFIGYDEHLQLVRIVKNARQLSYDLQHGFVTCRLYATITPARTPKKVISGTYAFGLQRVSGTERVELLEARALLKEDVEFFLTGGEVVEADSA